MRSGPTAARGAPPVLTNVPSASTTSRPSTMSSIFPYRVDIWPAPRHATQPPTVESAIDWGQCPHVTPWRSLKSSSKTSPNVPARTSTSSEFWSTATMPLSAVTSRSTPPKTGTLAPHTPLRPAAAVTGIRASLQSRSTAWTCAVSCGCTTTDACTATCASSAQIIASGHQSRLAAATAALSSISSAPVARRRLRVASSTSTRRVRR